MTRHIERRAEGSVPDGLRIHTPSRRQAIAAIGLWKLLLSPSCSPGTAGVFQGGQGSEESWKSFAAASTFWAGTAGQVSALLPPQLLLAT